MSERTRPNRRTFLGAATASLLDSTPAASRASAEVEPVRVLVIGTGARGSDLIRSLTTIEGVEVAGICDDDEPHLTQGARYASPQAQKFADCRQALDWLNPRAVVVAAPLRLHSLIAMDALDAGCAVFCEETICYRIDEARGLAKEVAEARRVFRVGLQRRANPIYQQAAAMVRAGVFGQVTAIKAQWHRNNNWRRPIPRTDPQWAALERQLHAPLSSTRKGPSINRNRVRSSQWLSARRGRWGLAAGSGPSEGIARCHFRQCRFCTAK